MTARDELAHAWELPPDEPDDVAADVRAELEHHLACAEEALAAAGRTPEEARREARARFGDVEAIERTCRRIRMGRRQLWNRLHWALTIVLLLALPLIALANVAASRAALARAEALRMEAHVMAERLRVTSEAARTHPEPVEHIIIGVGDVLRVDDTFNPDVRFTDKVAADGKFLLGDAGWVQAAGLTREEAERAFTETLGQFYLEASVRVTVDPWLGEEAERDE